MRRGHHEATVYTAAQVLGYLSPFIGAVGARVVLAVKAIVGRKDKL